MARRYFSRCNSTAAAAAAADGVLLKRNVLINN